MKFELFNPEAKTTPVYFVIRKSRKGHKVFLKYPAGFSISPAHWNMNSQTVREIYGTPFKDYNKTLDTIKKEATKIFKENDYFALDAGKIRLKIDVALGRSTKSTANDFFSYFLSYIERKEEDKGKCGQRHVRNAYYIFRKNFPGLTWNKIDYTFYNTLVSTLEKKKLSKNYIGTIVNKLKIVCREAYREGVNTNDAFMNFKVLSEQVYNVYLSEEELERLYCLKLTGYQDKARDLFLIGCFTGMRVENYLNLDNDINIDLQKATITAVVNKNGPRVTIPIHWIIREIIEKYNGLPKSISQQKLNKYIKEVCALPEAKLNFNVIQAKTIGGKRKELSQLKHEMISSHTARRSLCTNLYKRNTPLRFIMSITGHKTEAQCLHYIKTGLDEIADQVADMDFWKKPLVQEIGTNRLNNDAQTTVQDYGEITLKTQ